jgi:predicted nucleic acid-binding protein
MTVQELRELLVGLNKDSRVILAGDEEGNSYGDVDDAIGVDMAKDGKTEIITLYPSNYIDIEELRNI